MNSTDAFADVIRSSVLKYADRDPIVARRGGRAAWLFDFRAALFSPQWLNEYAELFWARFGARYPFQVGGMETVGIALTAAIVMKGVERGTPVNGFFIRKSRKKDGLMKQIEGTLSTDPIILVDDLMNSGSTFNKEILALEENGARVSALFAVLRFRALDAYEFAHKKNIAVETLYSTADFGIPLLDSDDPEVPKESFATRWRFASADPSRAVVVQKSAPVLYRDTVLFGADDGVLRALDAETGEVRWQFATGKNNTGKGILSSPIIVDDNVYFGAYDGVVYALSARDGSLKWRYEEADWVGSSPDINKQHGLLYIGLEFGLFTKRGGIVALDLESGHEVWRNYMQEYTHASPLYIAEENLVVIGSNDGIVYTYDAQSGARRWSYNTGGDIKLRCAYDALRKQVAVNSMDGKCHLLDAREGTPHVAIETNAGIYGSPLVYGDTLYVASLDKTLYAINLNTHACTWKFDTDGRIFSSPTIFDESLWIGSNDGKLYELDPASGALKTSFQTTERIVNGPIYDSAHKRIYVSTQANELYCLVRT